MECHDQLLEAMERLDTEIDGREVQEVSGMNHRRSLRPSAHEKTICVKLGQDVRRHPQHQQLQQRMDTSLDDLSKRTVPEGDTEERDFQETEAGL